MSEKERGGAREREIREALEAIRGTDLEVYIDENDHARQLVWHDVPWLLSRLSELEGEVARMRAALEDARHELTTLHGLYAFDGASPAETWRLDTGKTVEKVDEALASQAGEPSEAESGLRGERHATEGREG
jgi:hypothetical protein